MNNDSLKPTHFHGGVSRNEKREWTGIGKALLEDEADLALPKSAYSRARCDDFTCLIPTYPSMLQIFFRQPKASTVRNLLLLPFSQDVWILIMILIISTMIFLKILLIICYKSPIGLLPLDTIITSECFCWVVGFFCDIAWYIQPKASWLRLIFLTGSLTGVILFIYYTGVLVSVLSSNLVPIKTLTDLANSEIQVLTPEESTTILSIVENTPNASAIHKKLGPKMNTFPATALVAAAEELYGVITYPDVFYTIVRVVNSMKDGDICKNISSVPFTTVLVKAGVIISKNSIYKEFFNNRIIFLHESGLLNRWSRIYVSTFRPRCDKTDERSGKEIPINLSILDLFTAFAVFILGLISSVFILILELLFCRKVPQKYITEYMK